MAKRDLFAVAHPDDAEVMLGHAIASSEYPFVMVATNGEASTINMVGGDFVRAGRRLHESLAGLAYLGVAPQDQFYPDLGDGQLCDSAAELEEQLANCLEVIEPNRIFTLGEDGYDGHPDHQAVHKACLRALARLGLDCELYGLSNTESAGLIVPSAERKLGAMALHRSQCVIDDLERWGDVDAYTRLIVGPETFQQYA